jgi:hypothetical protein
MRAEAAAADLGRLLHIQFEEWPPICGLKSVVKATFSAASRNSDSYINDEFRLITES